MSKLWIVHRNPRRLDALARLSGLAAPDLVCGGPTGDAFAISSEPSEASSAASSVASVSAPAAILIGVEGDLELELEFLHRHRDLLEHSKRLFLTAPEDVDEVQRLFGASSEEILDSVPSERALRAFVLSAVAHRNAEPLAERRARERIAHRFTSWFGDIEIPGLLRALDPTRARLPLLVRGVPGSGRTLFARYAELFRARGVAGPTLRIHAREVTDAELLVSRLLAREHAGLMAYRTVWIDEIDSLGLSAQRAIGEWIRLDTAPTSAVGTGLRWVATSGPAGLTEGLESDLERAFAALSILVPSLADHPDALAPFAQQVACEWIANIGGGGTRQIGASALEALEAHAWSGDRAAVEAVLRSTLAATSHDPIEEVDLTSGHASFATRSAESESTDNRRLEALQPIREAVFVEPAGGSADTAPGALGGVPPEPDPPAASFDEFERAFLDGLPAAGPHPLSDSPMPSPAAARDISPEMSEASFRAADPSEESDGEPATSPLDVSAPDKQRGNADWRRLARSLSHEIRNPLVSIRTFTELLPEHFADPAFRERFTELVGRDVAHIDKVISRLARAAERESHEASRVDVSAMIEGLLDERRDQIAQDRLLVLRELERDVPIAWADAQSLEVALAGLLDRALASLPERGDLFVATRRIERAADGRPRLRVLLRHRNPELAAFDGSGLEELSSAANVLEYVLAETIVESSGGTLTIDSTDARETLILVDLQTPD